MHVYGVQVSVRCVLSVGGVGDWSGTSAHAHGGAVLSQTLGL